MTTWIIVNTNHNTHFGPYADKEQAQEARDRLATRGDSLGIKWPKKLTRVETVRLLEDLKGRVTFEVIK